MRRVNIPYLVSGEGAYIDLRASKTDSNGLVNTYSLATRTPNNVPLLSVTDVGPLSLNVAQPVLSKRPLYRNGMLWFDGVDDSLELVDADGVPLDGDFYFQMGVFHGES